MQVLFQAIFSTQPLQFAFSTSDGLLKEWRFRWKIDRYVSNFLEHVNNILRYEIQNAHIPDHILNTLDLPRTFNCSLHLCPACKLWRLSNVYERYCLLMLLLDTRSRHGLCDAAAVSSTKLTHRRQQAAACHLFYDLSTCGSAGRRWHSG